MPKTKGFTLRPSTKMWENTGFPICYVPGESKSLFSPTSS